ncbi:hypothetical protein [Deinococcus altitudinis]|uniref:hypothetical protein n=1 Tax=Deinococcus altitudinis TaxID=468914 RepID=UPI003891FC81
MSGTGSAQDERCSHDAPRPLLRQAGLGPGGWGGGPLLYTTAMPSWRVLIPLTLLLCSGVALASVLRSAPTRSGPAALPAVPTLPRDTAILSYPRLLPVSLNTDATPLLVSNSPETPQTSGLLYRDTVRGAARVTAYHVNGLEQPARLLIVAERAGDGVVSGSVAGGSTPDPGANLTLLRRGSALTPGPDPLIGQQTLLRYFSSGPNSAASPVGRLPRPIPAGTPLTLYDSGFMSPGEVVSVLIDLHTDAAVKISTYMLTAGERPGPDVPTLAPDGLHQRGTFTGANRDWSVSLPPPGAQPQPGKQPAGPTPTPLRLMFSDASDPPLTGTDALTGRPQLLRGNFGVLYGVSLQGAAGFLMAASARGGAYRGTLLMRDQARAVPLLIGRDRALLDGALPAAVWQLRSDAAHFEFMPANGSNLPLALVFYPDGVRRPLR